MVNNYVGLIDGCVGAGSIAAAYDMPFSVYVKGKLQRVKDSLFGKKEFYDHGSNLEDMLRKIAVTPINYEETIDEAGEKTSVFEPKVYSVRDVDVARNKSVSDIVNNERKKTREALSDINRREVEKYGLNNKSGVYNGRRLNQSKFKQAVSYVKNLIENEVGVATVATATPYLSKLKEPLDVSNMNEQQFMDMCNSGKFTYNEIQSAVGHALSQKIKSEIDERVRRIQLEDSLKLYESLHRGGN